MYHLSSFIWEDSLHTALKVHHIHTRHLQENHYIVILNYCLHFCNFQVGNNRIKLLMEYESITQKLLLPIQLILQNAKQVQPAHLPQHIQLTSSTCAPSAAHTINKFNMCTFRSTYHFQAVFNFTPSVLWHFPPMMHKTLLHH
jgi:hypothetical protein